MSGQVHVIGAGLAGLSAACTLAERGTRVIVSEALPQAGGRCRSGFDRDLGITIDNGSHLVLSGNRAADQYLKRIGGAGMMRGPDHAEYPFCDVRSGARWSLRLNDGCIPFWLFDAKRRAPGTTALDYARFGGLLHAAKDRSVGEIVVCRGPAWERMLHPLLLAVMNVEPERASAAIVARVLRETFLKGGAACIPRIASPTLSAAFVDPALRFLSVHGMPVRLRRKLTRIEFYNARVTALHYADGSESIAPRDRVILATPAFFARELVPDLIVPDQYTSILNGHFAVAPPKGAPPITGVLGGTAEWIFAFSDRIAVTVSNADALADAPREAVAKRLWADICAVYGPSGAMPPFAVVRERRATFAATPAQDAKRPGAQTRWHNLFLAGDYTDTGLPATIEGALRSGVRAAQLAGGMTA